MVGYLELPDGTTIEARDGLVIGRVAACDITVEDAKVSRRHARLVVERGVVEVEDLGSSNGTLLNGKPIQRRLVRSGDVISVGTSDIRFVEGPLPGAAAAARESAGSAVRNEPTADSGIDESLLGGDLLDDDFDFVDVPVAPPQLAPSGPSPPPPPPPPPRVERPQAAPLPKPAVQPTAKSKPTPPSQPAPSEPTTASGKRSDHGVLKFSQRPRGGLMTDDIGQRGSPTKLLMILAGIVVAITVGYFAFQIVTSP